MAMWWEHYVRLFLPALHIKVEEKRHDWRSF
ncbi:hypothetical protein ENROMA047B_00025 [Enterobacter rongchengensis]